jgi:hypothetical protein
MTAGNTSKLHVCRGIEHTLYVMLTLEAPGRWWGSGIAMSQSEAAARSVQY